MAVSIMRLGLRSLIHFERNAVALSVTSAHNQGRVCRKIIYFLYIYFTARNVKCQ